MDIKEIRLINLFEAIEITGSQIKLANAICAKSSYLSQIKNPEHKTNMGNDVARRIEASIYKPHGWMDRIHHAYNSSQARSIKKYLLTCIYKCRNYIL